MLQTINNNDQKPEITYPCEWGYTLIGKDRIKMENAINSIMDGLQHKIQMSHTSKLGKYISLKVNCIVIDEKRRYSYFSKFSQHPAFKIVM